MRVLTIGATGFIGARLTARLIADGHTVLGCVRRPVVFSRQFPGQPAIACDLARDIAPEHWLPRLRGVDCVINASGMLQGTDIAAVHARAPIALFEACRQAGVSRVIQISAISAEANAGTAYAETKRAADDHLAKTQLDWVILRPSLVYGAGSYGGTSLLRGLAGFPCAIPLPGGGDQVFQPIHVDDIAELAAALVKDPAISRRIIDPVGPEAMTLREILAALRRWLGFPAVRFLSVPMPMIRAAAKLGDALGWTPLNSTAVAQMTYGNAGDFDAFTAATGIRARSMSEMLARHPAFVQDRWHARLYFLRPLISTCLAITWLWSGVVGLIDGGGTARHLAESTGLSPQVMIAVGLVFSMIDISIATGIAIGRRQTALGIVQLILIIGYTVFLAFADPALLADPFGALLKNLPILVLVLVWLALADEH